MQQVQTRRLGASSHSVEYAWQSEEEAFVNALMGMALDHHVSRWKRIRMAAAGVLNTISIARLFGR